MCPIQVRLECPTQVRLECPTQVRLDRPRRFGDMSNSAQGRAYALRGASPWEWQAGSACHRALVTTIEIVSAIARLPAYYRDPRAKWCPQSRKQSMSWNGYAGQLVIDKCNPPYVSNAVGNGDIGQPVSRKCLLSDISNTVWNGYAGQKVIMKCPRPDVSNSVGNDYAGQLVMRKRTAP